MKTKILCIIVALVALICSACVSPTMTKHIYVRGTDSILDIEDTGGYTNTLLSKDYIPIDLNWTAHILTNKEPILCSNKTKDCYIAFFYITEADEITVSDNYNSTINVLVSKMPSNVKTNSYYIYGYIGRYHDDYELYINDEVITEVKDK